MSAPDIDSILEVPCKLVANPANLTAYPGGGTELGLVKDVVARPAKAYGALKTEALGTQTIEAIELGSAYVLSVAFRTFDDDAISKFFPGALTGASSGKKYVLEPVTKTDTSWKEGNLLSSRKLQLVVWPDDPDHYPMLILYAALPIVAQACEEWYARGKTQEWEGDFLAIQDASGRLYAKGLREDLSL